MRAPVICQSVLFCPVRCGLILVCRVAGMAFLWKSALSRCSSPVLAVICNKLEVHIQNLCALHIALHLHGLFFGANATLAVHLVTLLKFVVTFVRERQQLLGALDGDSGHCHCWGQTLEQRGELRDNIETQKRKVIIYTYVFLVKAEIVIHVSQLRGQLKMRV